MKRIFFRALRHVTLATAVALAAGGSFAQSSVSLYGIVDVLVDQQTAIGGGKSLRMDSGGMSTSFWGFGGTEDLGGGLKSIFAVEGFFRADVGAAGSFDGDGMFSRNAYVGLGGRWGTVTLGRQSSLLYLQSCQYNPFYASFTFSPTINQLYSGLGTFPAFTTDQGVVGGTAWSNVIQYATPTLAGFTLRAMYAPGEATGDGRSKRLSAQVQYAAGALSAGFVHQYEDFRSVPGDLTKLIAGFTSQSVDQAAASYDLGAAKLFGQYTYTRNVVAGNPFHVSSVQAGVTVPVGAARILASYGESKDGGGLDLTRRTASLSYDYALSRRTDVYASYTNDRQSGLSGGNVAGVGMRLRF